MWRRRRMNKPEHDAAIYRPRGATVPTEATKALEAAWQRRRAELGDWAPSNGWLIERKGKP